MVLEDAPHRLIVEGPDDSHTIIHLMKRHGLDFDTPDPRAPFVEEAGGYERALESLGVSVKSPDFRKLGIVIDANQDPAARWRQLKGRLEPVCGTLAEEPALEGTILNGPFPGTTVGTIGVWLMPDNSQPGALEDLLIDIVPPEDRLWQYAEHATADARNHDARYPDGAFKKAHLHAWLAWQEEPGLPFGSAIKAEYFRSDSSLAEAFVSWFKRLFIEGQA